MLHQTHSKKREAKAAAFLLFFLLSLASCGKHGKQPKGQKTKAATVMVDGSSTVYPITEAVAEEFQKEHLGVRVTAGVSGTGGGFKKFCRGDTDISDASRPIKKVEEKKCAQNGVEYIELPVAYDGIAIVVNPKETFVDCLTTEELKKVWQPNSRVKNWHQIRASFPSKPLSLYGRTSDSGTFDYFTEAIMGKSGATRKDYTASIDNNILVQGVENDTEGLAYIGLGYYKENEDRLRVLAIDGGRGCIKPSLETVKNGTYAPLSRPLLIYVSKKAAEREEIKSFVKFFLTKGKDLVGDVGYIPLPDRAYRLAQKRFQSRVTSSLFSGGAQIGVKIEDLLAKETSE